MLDGSSTLSSRVQRPWRSVLLAYRLSDLPLRGRFQYRISGAGVQRMNPDSWPLWQSGLPIFVPCMLGMADYYHLLSQTVAVFLHTPSDL